MNMQPQTCGPKNVRPKNVRPMNTVIPSAARNLFFLAADVVRNLSGGIS